jgi:hypothetical protein
LDASCQEEFELRLVEKRLSLTKT